MKTLRIGLVLTAVLAVLGFSGCSQPEPTPEQAKEQKFPKNKPGAGGGEAGGKAPAAAAPGAGVTE